MNAFRYDGEWKADLVDGRGVYNAYGNGIYTGEFKFGMREGVGTIVFTNGDEFTGEWFQDKPWGRGVYKSARDGSTYTGDWHSGIILPPFPPCIAPFFTVVSLSICHVVMS